MPSKPTADGKITKSGVYYGLADSHTIEISLDGKPAAMRLSDEVKPQFEQLKLAKDDKVQVTYYENADKQLILTAINLIK